MYLSFEDVQQYRKDGFILIHDVFNKAEVEQMIKAIDGGEGVVSNVSEVDDKKGKKVRLAFWDNLTGDIWSAASTSPLIVNNIRILMGEDICFYHGKVALKEAYTGGAFEWHQDYGYWYNGGFMYPHMMSAFVALDPSTLTNGCLRVIKGSHKLGRIEHKHVAGQIVADPERIALIEDRLETIDCEMPSGSVLFFDCNLLHSSAANESPNHRRSIITCYTAAGNTQVYNGSVVTRDLCPVGVNGSITS
jgi:ectoine hydroxylase-related dioxygenase (phytanoyl-CoA dioxygenase family)